MVYDSVTLELGECAHYMFSICFTLSLKVLNCGAGCDFIAIVDVGNCGFKNSVTLEFVSLRSWKFQNPCQRPF